MDNEEHAIGLRCVAAPILDEAGDPLASISVSGPIARVLDQQIPVFGDLVRQTAQKITTEFGGKPQRATADKRSLPS